MNQSRLFAASVLIFGIALLIRAGLVNLSKQTPDDWTVPIQLAEQFDPFLSRMEIIRPCHTKKSPPQPGDWLDRFPEGGQQFTHFVKMNESLPLHETYHGIDIQPLGEFDQTQQRLIAQMAEFIERFFGMPVKTLEPIRLEDSPPEFRRLRNDVEQVYTHWIMNERLLPNRRPDAMATVALVSCDLWSGEFGWLFGEALLANRLCVWSMQRMGDPHISIESFRLCLLRNLKTGVHEIGHVLGMPHCSYYECGMNGSRSLEEHDRRWLEFCPECQAKVWWTCGIDPVERCRSLAEFSEIMDWKREAKLFQLEEVLLKEKSKP